MGLQLIDSMSQNIFTFLTPKINIE